MLDRLGLAVLVNGWTAFSPLAGGVGLLGIVLVAAALAGFTVLPALLKRLLAGAGLVLIAGAALYQAGHARGAHEAFARDAKRAVALESARAEAAEAITRDLAAQAAKDLADVQADAAHLKDLNDALRHDPRRDGVCLDRALSRRLRRL